MIESAMYFGLGFFAAALLGLIILHFAWQQASRLTRQRVEAAIPLDREEISAERDRLRAEFALNIRKLEKQLETAREENAAFRMEIDGHSEETRSIAAERDASAENAAELENRVDDLRKALRAREDDLVRTSGALRESERTLETRTAELTALHQRLATSGATFEGDEGEAGVQAGPNLLASLQGDLSRQSEELHEARERIAALEDENATLRIQQVGRAIAREDDKGAAVTADKIQALAESTDQISLSAQILELEARNAEARAEIDRLTVEREQIMAMGGTTDAHSGTVSDAEAGRLRDKLKELAAAIAHDAMEAEGPASPIASLIGTISPDEAFAPHEPDRRESLADRIRRLAGRKRETSSPDTAPGTAPDA